MDNFGASRPSVAVNKEDSLGRGKTKLGLGRETGPKRREREADSRKSNCREWRGETLGRPPEPTFRSGPSV